MFWAIPSARANRARFARLPLAKNPAYPYRVFYKILRLEIGIDGFGVKKHVAS